MTPLQTALKFFQDCGPFLYPSLTLMALGVAIAIERFIFLRRARSDNRRLWARLKPLLEAGRMREADGMAEQSDAAMGRIVHFGLGRLHADSRREDIDAAMEEGMMEIVPRLEQRTHYLATFANVITLVGLLGTIIGLIKAFTAVAQVNAADKAEMLSASISIAMNNTAFALMVAIPFLLVHAFLQARTAEIVDGLEGARLSFLNLVYRGTASASGAVPASVSSSGLSSGSAAGLPSGLSSGLSAATAASMRVAR
jgi:biopolymer transport protein ExbB